MADRKRNWDKTPQAAEYRRNYNKEHYFNLQIMVPKDVAEKVMNAAERAGKSRTAFIVEAVEEKIARMDQE